MESPSTSFSLSSNMAAPGIESSVDPSQQSSMMLDSTTTMSTPISSRVGDHRPASSSRPAPAAVPRLVIPRSAPDHSRGSQRGPAQTYDIGTPGNPADATERSRSPPKDNPSGPAPSWERGVGGAQSSGGASDFEMRELRRQLKLSIDQARHLAEYAKKQAVEFRKEHQQ